MSDKPKRERIDWLKIYFWASLFVAIELAVLSASDPKGRIPTIFDDRGKHIVLCMIRDHVSPKAAAYLGLRNAISTPPTATPVAASGS